LSVRKFIQVIALIAANSVKFLYQGFFDSGLKNRPVGEQVGVRAAMGLDIRVFRAKELAGFLLREGLNRVYIFIPSVKTVAGEALGIFVGQKIPHGKLHRHGTVILAGDKFNPFPLVLQFPYNGMGNFRRGFRCLGKVTKVGQQAYIHFFRRRRRQISGYWVCVHAV